MDLEKFQEIVDKAITELPEEFKEKMDNVAVLVEVWPTHQELDESHVPPNSLLFGLYRGIPKTNRTINYTSLPDKITIFAGPILAVSKSLEDAKKRIKDTVLHEIGHHFGMSDEQLRKVKLG